METTSKLARTTMGPHQMQSTSVAVSQDVLPAGSDDPLAIQAPDTAEPFDYLEDLLAALRRRARPGVRVEVCPIVQSAGVRLDVTVSSESVRIGVICDHLDAARVAGATSFLDEMFVDRAYLSSAFDAIVDPDGVARGVASQEPDLFRRASRSRRIVARVSALARGSRGARAVDEGLKAA